MSFGRNGKTGIKSLPLSRKLRGRVLMRKAVNGVAVIIISIMVLFCGYRVYVDKNFAIETVVISIGDQGESVRAIQQRLKDYGYYTGVVDGIYGQGTYEAVRNFQLNNGLTADGIAGDRTISALGLVLGGDRRNISDSDIEIIARAIYGEGRGEPYEGQVAIGAVIINRLESPDFPDTVSGVVYQKGAFDAVRDGQINLTPNETAYQAALDAINGWDPTGGALYYWNPTTATSPWIFTVPVTARIGRHVFGVK